MFTLTVKGSTISVDATDLNAWPTRNDATSLSISSLTASEFSGVPSWNLMFGRSLIVHDV